MSKRACFQFIDYGFSFFELYLSYMVLYFLQFKEFRKTKLSQFYSWPINTESETIYLKNIRLPNFLLGILTEYILLVRKFSLLKN